MISNRNRLRTALILNILLVFIDAFALFHAFFYEGGSFNWRGLRYFSHLTNIFALFTAIGISFSIMNEVQSGGKNKTPYFLRLLKFSSTNALLLSFLVTVFILVPADSMEKGRMYLLSGYFFFEHIVCPFLAVVSVVILGEYRTFGKGEIAFSVIPIALYAATVYALTAFRVIPAPFAFFDIYGQGWFLSVIWFIVLLAASFLSASILLFLCRRIRVSDVE